MAVLVVGIACNHPQEHSFYNVLAGDNISERFELDYWDLSVKQAYDAILKEEKGKVTVGVLNLPTLWGLEENLSVLPKSEQEQLVIAEDWREAEYLIINTTYAFMYSEEDYQNVKENYLPIDSISSYGNVICEVYHCKQ